MSFAIHKSSNNSPWISEIESNSSYRAKHNISRNISEPKSNSTNNPTNNPTNIRRQTNNNNDRELQECCVCTESSFVVRTNCNHYVCLNCLTKLRKIECPYCRGSLDELPQHIKLMMPGFVQQTNTENEHIASISYYEDYDNNYNNYAPNEE